MQFIDGYMFVNSESLADGSGKLSLPSDLLAVTHVLEEIGM